VAGAAVGAGPAGATRLRDGSYSVFQHIGDGPANDRAR